MKFLSNPAKIRRHLVNALETSESLDAAVAFVGRDWVDIIGTFSGPVRLICWLSSTNTNPYAVEQMMRRENICVHHLPAMHAKVYLLEGQLLRCIVGSANLTENALSEDNASGQCEAAIEVWDKETVRTIKRWFEDLWKEHAQPISKADLHSAKEAWDKARSSKRSSGNRRPEHKIDFDASSLLPVDWKPSSQLSELADKVRDNDLSEGIEREHVLLDIAQHGRRRDLRQVISWVVEWTGHEGKYRPALDESSRRIRKAFRTLFDHSRGPDSRLRDLDTNGECKIKGFGLASLTMILHWKFPREYPPFNRRTKRFLKDFEFEEFVPKTLSPTQYAKWIAFAQELSERLQLPSAGHIDRIVWEYTQDLDMEL